VSPTDFARSRITLIIMISLNFLLDFKGSWEIEAGISLQYSIFAAEECIYEIPKRRQHLVVEFKRRRNSG
jgi:hypothetical protein